MNDMNFTLRELAQALRTLEQFQPSSKSDLNKWYEIAEGIKRKLIEPAGLAPQLPHFIWHYFSDADIRMKDLRYAKMQNAKVRLLIDALEKNEASSDSDLEME